MMASEERADGACSGCCTKCPSSGSETGGPPENLAGWRMVTASALVFLLPLAAAMAGAILAGSERTMQVVGAALGFAVGVAVAVTVARLFRPRNR